MTSRPRSRTSTNVTRTRGRSTISTTTGGAGRTRAGAAPTSISSIRTSRTPKSARSSSPAAAPRRRPSTPLRAPAARVIGIDFSATSVRHTEALKHKYGLANLEVHQLPIDRVGELDMSFDEVICTGVLHHTTDPDAALRALRDVLAPDGAMHLMVYAPYGRTGIYMLQEFCRRIGIRAVDAEIHDLVVALGALPAAHPLARLLRDAPDFFQEAALADALLNPRDRAYSVPQLMEFIGRAGLSFGRWLQTGSVQPALRRHGTTAAVGSDRSARRHAAVRRRRALPRDDAEPQCDRLPRGPSRPRATDRFFRSRLARHCARADGRHAVRSGEAAAGRRSGADQPGSHRIATSTCRSTRRRSACSTRSTRSAASARSPAPSPGKPSVHCSSACGGTTRSFSTHLADLAGAGGPSAQGRSTARPTARRGR